MTVVDYIIVFGYLAIMLTIGVLHQSKASDNVRSYFLGGQKIPWWITAMSSSMSSIDITGTMVNVSILYFMGVRSIYYNIWVIGGVALMCHLGRWIRRSNVVTAAEWMTTRFGKGWAGEVPRMTVALVSVGSLLGYVAYAFVGVGKFVSVFAPALSADPQTNVVLYGITVICFTALYSILGGLFSVAYTDLIQTFILFLTSVYITILAFNSVSAEWIAANTPAGWDVLTPTTHIPYLANVQLGGYEAGAWEFFLPWLVMWGFQAFLSFVSGPGMGAGMQFMLSTKSTRDTCKQGAGYELLTFPKWTLVVGIAVLALKTPGIEIGDSDMVLPKLMNAILPWGIRGFVLIGFLAAFMSTFSISINNGVSYIIRDLYIRHMRPKAARREFVLVTYVSSALFVLIGILIGLKIKSVLELGVWVFTTISGSMLIPLVLRWYWWRFNGWGFAAGMIAAFTVAITQKFIQGAIGWQDYHFYYLMVAVSLTVSITVTLTTPTTDRKTLHAFYKRIMPWGFWGPIRKELEALNPGWQKEKYFWKDFTNCAIGAVALFSLNLMPVYFMLHNWVMFFRLLVVFLVTATIMYFSWYKTLPPDDSKELAALKDETEVDEEIPDSPAYAQ